MNIDISTLAIVLGILSVLQVVVISIQYLTNRTYKGIGWWLLWSASTALGFIFMLLRICVPIGLISISIILTNVLILLGHIFLYTGIMQFLDRKEKPVIIVLIFSLFILVTFYAMCIYRNDNTRTLILYLSGAIVSLLAGQALLTHKMPSISASANFLSVVFFAHSCYFVFRATAAFTIFPIDEVFSPTLLQTATFLVQLITSYLWAFGLIIMVNQRSNAESSEAKEQFELIFSTGPDSALITRLNDGCFVEINEGFTTLTGFTRAEVIGKSILDVSIWQDPTDRQKAVTELNEKRFVNNLEAIFLRKDGTQFSGMVSAKLITLQGLPHIISVTRDITDRKKREEDMQELISRLQKAIEEIKTLKGILPICSSCKKIRDDEGYWQQVEAYVTKHTQAQFSHGICPDCMKKLYPEFCKDWKAVR